MAAVSKSTTGWDRLKTWEGREALGVRIGVVTKDPVQAARPFAWSRDARLEAGAAGEKST
jgi:hypothetical protein